MNPKLGNKCVADRKSTYPVTNPKIKTEQKKEEKKSLVHQLNQSAHHIFSHVPCYQNSGITIEFSILIGAFIGSILIVNKK